MTLTKPFSTIRSSKGQDKLPEINSSSPQLKETLNNPLNTKSVESAQQLLQQQPQSQKSPKELKTGYSQIKPTEPPSPEVLFELNQIIQRQNQEIMRVFMEEQANENRRDDKLRNCKSENRAKLEKLQSLERQKAQQRIQKLQEQHQYEQYQFKLAHNLIG